MRENIQLVIIILLLVGWYATAIAGMQQKNKYHDEADKNHGLAYTIVSLEHKLEQAENSNRDMQKEIAILKKTIIEYKDKVSKISSFFKDKL